MRAMLSVLVLGWSFSTGVALAQDPAPQRSADDFARAIESAPCDNGQERDQDGLCASDEGATRGFNLGVQNPSRATPQRRRPPAPAATRPNLLTPASVSTLGDLRITFRSGSTEMTSQGRAEARSFADALQRPALSHRRFEIAGHTDASGSSQHNLELSQARADAVLEFLVANGVDRSRLQAKGYGSERLALPDSPRDPANRRVEARSLN
jgi:outer membrane protein OmpA-like peptidoglycan-associated protein